MLWNTGLALTPSCAMAAEVTTANGIDLRLLAGLQIHERLAKGDDVRMLLSELQKQFIDTTLGFPDATRRVGTNRRRTRTTRRG